jgi:hypothetical protein
VKKVPTQENPIRCTNCRKKGHWAKDCWSKPRKNEKAHLAEAEEDELSLFLVSATIVQKISPSTDSVLAVTGDDSMLTAATALPSPDVT